MNNADIENLSDEVMKQIEGLLIKVDQINDGVVEIKKEVDEIKDRVGVIREDVDQLKKQIENKDKFGNQNKAYLTPKSNDVVASKGFFDLDNANPQLFDQRDGLPYSEWWAIRSKSGC